MFHPIDNLQAKQQSTCPARTQPSPPIFSACDHAPSQPPALNPHLAANTRASQRDPWARNALRLDCRASRRYQKASGRNTTVGRYLQVGKTSFPRTPDTTPLALSERSLYDECGHGYVAIATLCSLVTTDEREEGREAVEGRLGSI